MPKTVVQSSLAAKIKAKGKKAFENAKAKPPEFDTGGNLPAGIEGGVAQLVDCCIKTIKPGKKNAGELMFYAAGVVVEPAEHAGRKIAGQRTQINEVLCDTPGRARETFGDHLEWVMNELKKLSPETNWDDISEDELEGTMKSLMEAKPYFRFRTWVGSKTEIVKLGNKYMVGTKSYPTEAAAKAANPFAGAEPMVNHVWGGVCEHDGDGEAVEAAVQDESGDAAGEAQDAQEAPEAEAGDEESLSALAALADDQNDRKAQKTLTDKAVEVGIEKKTVLDAQSWAAVVEMIEEASGEGGAAPDADEQEAKDEDEDIVAKIGDVYLYKAPGKKKAVECEVKATFNKSSTCTLVNLTDGKTLYKNVDWADLVVPQ